MSVKMVKNYADTWLYSQGDYEKNLYEFLISSKVVNKTDNSFNDIKYEVKKRQIHNCLVKVLENKNVVLLYGDRELPKSFKVFAAKDIKSGDKKVKVFIDVTNVFTDEDGKYELKVRNTDIFITYLVRALASLIYHTDQTKLFNNTTVIETTTECFTKLFSYIIDYLRISNVDKGREKTIYLSALYYQINIMGKEGDSIYNRATKLSGLNKRECDVIEMLIEEDSFLDINKFVTTLAKVLKADNESFSNYLDTGAFTSKWIYLFGASTGFGLELFTAFSNMLTDAYVGAYVNNQKTIEKICRQSFVQYSIQLLKLGSELL